MCGRKDQCGCSNAKVQERAGWDTGVGGQKSGDGVGPCGSFIDLGVFFE